MDPTNSITDSNRKACPGDAENTIEIVEWWLSGAREGANHPWMIKGYKLPVTE